MVAKISFALANNVMLMSRLSSSRHKLNTVYVIYSYREIQRFFTVIFHLQLKRIENRLSVTSDITGAGELQR